MEVILSEIHGRMRKRSHSSYGDELFMDCSQNCHFCTYQIIFETSS